MKSGLVVSLHPKAQLVPVGPEALELQQGGCSCLLHPQSEGLRQALHHLAEGAPSEELLRGLEASGGSAFQLEELLGRLGDGGFLCHTVFDGARAVARLVPTTGRFRWPHPRLDSAQRYRLSRFALVRREDEQMVLETPFCEARLELKSPCALGLLAQLAQPCRLEDLPLRGCTLGPTAREGMLELLAAMEALTSVGEDGRSSEDEQVPSTWEPHDLMLHAISRRRRPQGEYGANWRFDERPHPDALVRQPWPGPRRSLSRPDIDGLSQTEASFTRVLESRRTQRRFGEAPLTLEHVSHFLHRVSHPKRIPLGGTEFEVRPYAWGGGVYPELYLAAYRCTDLEPGLYHYDARAHQVVTVTTEWALVEPMVLDAQSAIGDKPPLLVLTALRFPASALKYQSLAYALNLKNCGALMQTMYLVATAMGLACCGVGAGNSDHFARASGLNYYLEGSLSEFALGCPPD